MYEDIFAERLTSLRTNKGVSARNMSLSIGQSADYINKVENKRIVPSMTAFFNICEYLEITPKDFFDFNSKNPTQQNEIVEKLKKLDKGSLNIIFELVDKLERN